MIFTLPVVGVRARPRASTRIASVTGRVPSRRAEWPRGLFQSREGHTASPRPTPQAGRSSSGQERGFSAARPRSVVESRVMIVATSSGASGWRRRPGIAKARPR